MYLLNQRHAIDIKHCVSMQKHSNANRNIPRGGQKGMRLGGAIENRLISFLTSMLLYFLGNSQIRITYGTFIQKSLNEKTLSVRKGLFALGRRNQFIINY
jgi:hypothetical protein